MNKEEFVHKKSKNRKCLLVSRENSCLVVLKAGELDLLSASLILLLAFKTSEMQLRGR